MLSSVETQQVSLCVASEKKSIPLNDHSLFFHVSVAISHLHVKTNCNATGAKKKKAENQFPQLPVQSYTVSIIQWRNVTGLSGIQALNCWIVGDMYHLEALAHAECFRLTMDCCWAPNMLIEGAAVSSIERLCFRRWSQTSAIPTEVLFIHQTRHCCCR